MQYVEKHIQMESFLSTISEKGHTVCITPNGDRAYYVDGVLHREDGPAIIRLPSGVIERREWWYYRGRCIEMVGSEKEMRSYIRNQAFW